MVTAAFSVSATLSPLLEYLEVATPAGLPPPCSEEALVALPQFAKAMDLQIPPGYSQLLTLVNGFTIADSLRIHGVGVPVYDEFGRSDFLLSNLERRRTRKDRLTVFGLAQERDWLVWSPAKQEFQMVDKNSGDVRNAGSYFEDLIATAIASLQ